MTWGAVQMIRLKHDLREAVPLKDDVWACDNAASPFIFGILHPRIYVPAEMEPERLDDVIAHEQAHIDHKDHWWKALAFVILAWRWSDPFMWLAFWLFARDLEERCDEEVISSMEQQQRGHYARSLLACSSAKGMSRGPRPLEKSMSSSGSSASCLSDGPPDGHLRRRDRRKQQHSSVC